MFLIATVRFRDSSVRSGTSSSAAGSLDEDPPAAVVDHHLGDGRIAQQILDRPQEREDAIEAAHSAPRCDVIEVAGLHVEVVRLQVAELRRQRIEAVVRQDDGLRVLQFREHARRETT